MSSGHLLYRQFCDDFVLPNVEIPLVISPSSHYQLNIESFRSLFFEKVAVQLSSESFLHNSTDVNIQVLNTVSNNLPNFRNNSKTMLSGKTNDSKSIQDDASNVLTPLIKSKNNHRKSKLNSKGDSTAQQNVQTMNKNEKSIKTHISLKDDRPHKKKHKHRRYSLENYSADVNLKKTEFKEDKEIQTLNVKKQNKSSKPSKKRIDKATDPLNYTANLIKNSQLCFVISTGTSPFEVANTHDSVMKIEGALINTKQKRVARPSPERNVVEQTTSKAPSSKESEQKKGLYNGISYFFKTKKLFTKQEEEAKNDIKNHHTRDNSTGRRKESVVEEKLYKNKSSALSGDAKIAQRGGKDSGLIKPNVMNTRKHKKHVTSINSEPAARQTSVSVEIGNTDLYNVAKQMSKMEKGEAQVHKLKKDKKQQCSRNSVYIRKSYSSAQVNTDPSQQFCSKNKFEENDCKASGKLKKKRRSQSLFTTTSDTHQHNRNVFMCQLKEKINSQKYKCVGLNDAVKELDKQTKVKRKNKKEHHHKNITLEPSDVLEEKEIKRRSREKAKSTKTSTCKIAMEPSDLLEEKEIKRRCRDKGKSTRTSACKIAMEPSDVLEEKEIKRRSREKAKSTKTSACKIDSKEHEKVKKSPHSGKHKGVVDDRVSEKRTKKVSKSALDTVKVSSSFSKLLSSTHRPAMDANKDKSSFLKANKSENNFSWFVENNFNISYLYDEKTKAYNITKDQMAQFVNQLQASSHSKASTSQECKNESTKQKSSRKEVSFSKLNLNPLTQVTQTAAPFYTWNVKPKKQAFDRKSAFSEAITEKEKHQYFNNDNLVNKRRAVRNFTYPETIVESSKKGIFDDKGSIEFTVEGVEPPKKIRANETKNNSFSDNSPKKMRVSVLSVLDIKPKCTVDLEEDVNKREEKALEGPKRSGVNFKKSVSDNESIKTAQGSETSRITSNENKLNIQPNFVKNQSKISFLSNEQAVYETSYVSKTSIKSKNILDKKFISAPKIQGSSSNSIYKDTEQPQCLKNTPSPKQELGQEDFASLGHEVVNMMQEYLGEDSSLLLHKESEIKKSVFSTPGEDFFTKVKTCIEQRLKTSTEEINFCAEESKVELSNANANINLKLDPDLKISDSKTENNLKESDERTSPISISNKVRVEKEDNNATKSDVRSRMKQYMSKLSKLKRLPGSRDSSRSSRDSALDGSAKGTVSCSSRDSSIPSLISKKSIQSLVSKKSRQSVISIKSRQSLISKKSRQSIISKKSRQSLISKKSKQSMKSNDESSLDGLHKSTPSIVSTISKAGSKKKKSIPKTKDTRPKTPQEKQTLLYNSEQENPNIDTVTTEKLDLLPNIAEETASQNSVQHFIQNKISMELKNSFTKNNVQGLNAQMDKVTEEVAPKNELQINKVLDVVTEKNENHIGDKVTEDIENQFEKVLKNQLDEKFKKIAHDMSQRVFQAFQISTDLAPTFLPINDFSSDSRTSEFCSHASRKKKSEIAEKSNYGKKNVVQLNKNLSSDKWSSGGSSVADYKPKKRFKTSKCVKDTKNDPKKKGVNEHEPPLDDLMQLTNLLKDNTNNDNSLEQKATLLEKIISKNVMTILKQKEEDNNAQATEKKLKEASKPLVKRRKSVSPKKTPNKKMEMLSKLEALIGDDDSFDLIESKLNQLLSKEKENVKSTAEESRDTSTPPSGRMEKRASLDVKRDFRKGLKSDSSSFCSRASTNNPAEEIRKRQSSLVREKKSIIHPIKVIKNDKKAVISNDNKQAVSPKQEWDSTSSKRNFPKVSKIPRYTKFGGKTSSKSALSTASSALHPESLFTSALKASLEKLNSKVGLKGGNSTHNSKHSSLDKTPTSSLPISNVDKGSQLSNFEKRKRYSANIRAKTSKLEAEKSSEIEPPLFDVLFVTSTIPTVNPHDPLTKYITNSDELSNPRRSDASSLGMVPTNNPIKEDISSVLKLTKFPTEPVIKLAASGVNQTPESLERRSSESLRKSQNNMSTISLFSKESNLLQDNYRNSPCTTSKSSIDVVHSTKAFDEEPACKTYKNRHRLPETSTSVDMVKIHRFRKKKFKRNHPINTKHFLGEKAKKQEKINFKMPKQFKKSKFLLRKVKSSQEVEKNWYSDDNEEVTLFEPSQLHKENSLLLHQFCEGDFTYQQVFPKPIAQQKFKSENKKFFFKDTRALLYRNLRKTLAKIRSLRQKRKQKSQKACKKLANLTKSHNSLKSLCSCMSKSTVSSSDEFEEKDTISKTDCSKSNNSDSEECYKIFAYNSRIEVNSPNMTLINSPVNHTNSSNKSSRCTFESGYETMSKNGNFLCKYYMEEKNILKRFTDFSNFDFPHQKYPNFCVCPLMTNAQSRLIWNKNDSRQSDSGNYSSAPQDTLIPCRKYKAKKNFSCDKAVSAKPIKVSFQPCVANMSTSTYYCPNDPMMQKFIPDCRLSLDYQNYNFKSVHQKQLCSNKLCPYNMKKRFGSFSTYDASDSSYKDESSNSDKSSEAENELKGGCMCASSHEIFVQTKKDNYCNRACTGECSHIKRSRTHLSVANQLGASTENDSSEEQRRESAQTKQALRKVEFCGQRLKPKCPKIREMVQNKPAAPEENVASEGRIKETMCGSTCRGKCVSQEGRITETMCGSTCRGKCVSQEGRITETMCGSTCHGKCVLPEGRITETMCGSTCRGKCISQEGRITETMCGSTCRGKCVLPEGRITRTMCGSTCRGKCAQTNRCKNLTCSLPQSRETIHKKSIDSKEDASSTICCVPRFVRSRPKCSSATNYKKFEKESKQCKEYAQKVRQESDLRADGRYKQWSDFKEIPLKVLLCKGCVPKKKCTTQTCPCYAGVKSYDEASPQLKILDDDYSVCEKVPEERCAKNSFLSSTETNLVAKKSVERLSKSTSNLEEEIKTTDLRNENISNMTKESLMTLIRQQFNESIKIILEKTCSARCSCIKEPEGAMSKDSCIKEPEDELSKHSCIKEPEGEMSKDSCIKEPEGEMSKHSCIKEPEGEMSKDSRIKEPKGEMPRDSKKVVAVEEVNQNSASQVSVIDPTFEGTDSVSNTALDEESSARKGQPEDPSLISCHKGSPNYYSLPVANISESIDSPEPIVVPNDDSLTKPKDNGTVPNEPVVEYSSASSCDCYLDFTQISKETLLKLKKQIDKCVNEMLESENNPNPNPNVHQSNSLKHLFQSSHSEDLSKSSNNDVVIQTALEDSTIHSECFSKNIRPLSEDLTKPFTMTQNLLEEYLKEEVSRDLNQFQSNYTPEDYLNDSPSKERENVPPANPCPSTSAEQFCVDPTYVKSSDDNKNLPRQPPPKEAAKRFLCGSRRGTLISLKEVINTAFTVMLKSSKDALDMSSKEAHQNLLQSLSELSSNKTQDLPKKNSKRTKKSKSKEIPESVEGTDLQKTNENGGDNNCALVPICEQIQVVIEENIFQTKLKELQSKSCCYVAQMQSDVESKSDLPEVSSTNLQINANFGTTESQDEVNSKSDALEVSSTKFGATESQDEVESKSDVPGVSSTNFGTTESQDEVESKSDVPEVSSTNFGATESQDEVEFKSDAPEVSSTNLQINASLEATESQDEVESKSDLSDCVESEKYEINSKMQEIEIQCGMGCKSNVSEGVQIPSAEILASKSFEKFKEIQYYKESVTPLIELIENKSLDILKTPKDYLTMSEQEIEIVTVSEEDLRQNLQVAFNNSLLTMIDSPKQSSLSSFRENVTVFFSKMFGEAYEDDESKIDTQSEEIMIQKQTEQVLNSTVYESFLNELLEDPGENPFEEPIDVLSKVAIVMTVNSLKQESRPQKCPGNPISNQLLLEIAKISLEAIIQLYKKFFPRKNIDVSLKTVVEELCKLEVWNKNLDKSMTKTQIEIINVLSKNYGASSKSVLCRCKSADVVTFNREKIKFVDEKSKSDLEKSKDKKIDKPKRISFMQKSTNQQMTESAKTNVLQKTEKLTAKEIAEREKKAKVLQKSEKKLTDKEIAEGEKCEKAWQEIKRKLTNEEIVEIEKSVPVLKSPNRKLTIKDIAEIERTVKALRSPQRRLTSNEIKEIEKSVTALRSQDRKLSKKEMADIEKIEKVLQSPERKLTNKDIADIEKTVKALRSPERKLTSNEIKEIEKSVTALRSQDRKLSKKEMAEIEKIEKVLKSPERKLTNKDIADIEKTVKALRSPERRLTSNELKEMERSVAAFRSQDRKLSKKEMADIEKIEKVLKSPERKLTNKDIADIEKSVKALRSPERRLTSNELKEMERSVSAFRSQDRKLSKKELVELEKIEKVLQSPEKKLTNTEIAEIDRRVRALQLSDRKLTKKEIADMEKGLKALQSSERKFTYEEIAEVALIDKALQSPEKEYTRQEIAALEKSVKALQSQDRKLTHKEIAKIESPERQLTMKEITEIKSSPIASQLLETKLTNHKIAEIEERVKASPSPGRQLTDQDITEMESEPKASESPRSKLTNKEIAEMESSPKAFESSELKSTVKETAEKKAKAVQSPDITLTNRKMSVIDKSARTQVPDRRLTIQEITEMENSLKAVQSSEGNLTYKEIAAIEKIERALESPKRKLTSQEIADIEKSTKLLKAFEYELKDQNVTEKVKKPTNSLLPERKLTIKETSSIALNSKALQILEEELMDEKIGESEKSAQTSQIPERKLTDNIGSVEMSGTTLRSSERKIADKQMEEMEKRTKAAELPEKKLTDKEISDRERSEEALKELRKKLTDKEVFDRVLDSYEKEESIVERLSQDEEFFRAQLGMVKSKESIESLLSQSPLIDIHEKEMLDHFIYDDSYEGSEDNTLRRNKPSKLQNTSGQVSPEASVKSIAEKKKMEQRKKRTKPNSFKSKVSRAFKRDSVKDIVPPRDDDRQSMDLSYLRKDNDHKSLASSEYSNESLEIESPVKVVGSSKARVRSESHYGHTSHQPRTKSLGINPSEIGKAFLRGFRTDNINLCGDVCIISDPQDEVQALKRTESLIHFSERDTPLDFLLALGFSIDEASNAIKDEDVKNRLSAAITEARVWINKISSVQGTLLYLISYKAKPRIMRYFLQLVEAIINGRIRNAVKLDGFLKVLEKVEDGDLAMITIIGSDKLQDEDNDEKVVRRQLREIFINVYKIAEAESKLMNKPLTKHQLVLLRILAAKYRAGLHPHLQLIAKYIGQGLLNTDVQLEAAMIYLSRLNTDYVDMSEFEAYCAIECPKKKK